MRIQKKCELKISAYQNEEDSGSHGRIHTWGLGNFGERKKFGPFLDLCVSSLRRGHANLLCIVPILSDVPEGTSLVLSLLVINIDSFL